MATLYALSVAECPGLCLTDADGTPLLMTEENRAAQHWEVRWHFDPSNALAGIILVNNHSGDALRFSRGDSPLVMGPSAFPDSDVLWTIQLLDASVPYWLIQSVADTGQAIDRKAEDGCAPPVTVQAWGTNRGNGQKWLLRKVG